MMDEQEWYGREIYAEGFKLMLAQSDMAGASSVFFASMKEKRQLNQRNRKAPDFTLVSEENWRFSPLWRSQSTLKTQ